MIQASALDALLPSGESVTINFFHFFIISECLQSGNVLTTGPLDYFIISSWHECSLPCRLHRRFHTFLFSYQWLSTHNNPVTWARPSQYLLEQS